MVEWRPVALSLPTLLSPALVAFTVEFDNEFEQRMPHRTTALGRGDAPRGSPWLTSQAMWSNVLRHVDAGGVPVRALEQRARTALLSLGGLQRWRYIVLEADPAGGDQLVLPTRAGRQAQEVWRPLEGVIEDRWRSRFGKARIDALRSALLSVRAQLGPRLPRYLPLVFPAMGGRAEVYEAGPLQPGDEQEADLSALLAQILLAFTHEYEQRSKIGLSIAANTLRVIAPGGTAVRDLPRLTGVSKEAHTMCVGRLQRIACAVVEPSPAGRGKVVRLTEKGARAQRGYHHFVAETEDAWRSRFGKATLRALREPLEELVGDGPTAAAGSPLFAGLTPYPEGWRARVRPPETLPHHPMVLHRGGYPDGS